jgi:hypothetical protein
MRVKRLLTWAAFQIAASLLAVTLLPGAVPAQEEVTSSIRRYKEREASTGYYEQYEVKPRRAAPLVGRFGSERPAFPYAPSAARVRVRTYLADSHAGIQFYKDKRCDECHVAEAGHSHTVRGNVTCRQCHGGEPIASLSHYFSPLNPIRRHAYVCAKCHEGANASFATYLVHEPLAGASKTRKIFPSLYYSNWFMYLLIVGTLGFFGLHTLIWVGKESYHAIREKMKPEPEPKPEIEPEPEPEPKAESPPEKPEPKEPENE